jgi:adenylylsulfate kinase
VADAVAEALSRRGLPVERLDGDLVREVLPATGFSRSERDEHLRRVGFLASRLAANGITVVASFVSPYAESRASVRAMCESFFEVYVSTPLDVCERRDPKGLYARARRGEIPAFTGVNDPYEVPPAPEAIIDGAALPPDVAARMVIEALDRKGDVA